MRIHPAVPLLFLTVACGTDASDARDAGSPDTTAQPSAGADTPAPPPPRDSAVAEPGAPRSDLRGYDTVFVYFDEPAEGGVVGPRVPRPRAVPADTDALSFSLQELLAGPTPADESEGPLYSWFSGETAGMLRSVTLADGFAVVELGDLRPVIPNASSSAGSTMLLGQLEATVFQFPQLRRVEFRIDGSCEAFMAWLQIECVPIRRSDFTPPPGYRSAIR